MSEAHEKVNVLLDECRGIYIPQDFALYCSDYWQGVSEEDEKILLAGPDHSLYWEVWDDVLSNAFLIDDDVYKWLLYQNGNLFAYREDTTESERNYHFGF